VYIASRAIGSAQKFSLHESGDWRYQWVTEEQAERYTAGPDRLIEQWARPDVGPAGWTPGLSILVPAEDVCTLEGDDQAREGVEWIPEPPPGTIVGIHVVVANPNGGTVSLSRAAPLGAFALADDRAVIVIVSVRNADAALAASLEQQRARVRSAVARSQPLIVGPLRVGLITSDELGNRAVWDLAVVPLPAAEACGESG
jgi:hypothetical protein